MSSNRASLLARRGRASQNAAGRIGGVVLYAHVLEHLHLIISCFSPTGIPEIRLHAMRTHNSPDRASRLSRGGDIERSTCTHILSIDIVKGAVPDLSKCRSETTAVSAMGEKVSQMITGVPEPVMGSVSCG